MNEKTGNKRESPSSTLPRRAAQFLLFHEVIQKLLPARIMKWVDDAFFFVSPRVPIALRSALREPEFRTAFLASYGLTFFFCFCVCFLFAFFGGTLIGADENVQYFLRDWQNITNYTVICPIYVSLSTLLLLTYVKIKSLDVESEVKEAFSAPNSFPDKLPVPIVVFFMLAFAALNTTFYVGEALDEAIYAKRFWFLEESAAGGRQIGAFGVYYGILNFCLMTFAVMSIFVFFGFCAIAKRLGEFIKNARLSQDVSFDYLKRKLEYFTYSYLISKGLVAAFMLNAYTWKAERPEGSYSLLLMQGVLTCFGLIFTPFPRYYVQHQWYVFDMRRHERGLIDEVSYKDLRQPFQQGLAYFLDGVIIVAFINAMVKIQF